MLHPMSSHSTSNCVHTTSLFVSSSQSFLQDPAAPKTLPSIQQVPSMAVLLHFPTSLEVDRPPIMPPMPPENKHHVTIEQLVTQGEPSWLNELLIKKCMCLNFS